MTALNLADRTALVTGAASGIGAALARRLDLAGIGRVIAIDRNAAALEALDLDCDASRYAGDVADESLWARIAADCSPIHYAALNAGIMGAGKPIVDTDLADWRATMATNLDGMFLGLRCVLTAMLATGTAGSIVLTGSVSGLRAYGTADYAASKAAVHHLAKIAAREAGALGIRVNAIAPGGVDTAIWDQADAFRAEVDRHGSRERAIEEMGKAGGPLGRFATPDEIAAHIAFLLSDDAAMITGAVLTCDGGMSA